MRSTSQPNHATSSEAGRRPERPGRVGEQVRCSERSYSDIDSPWPGGGDTSRWIRTRPRALERLVGLLPTVRVNTGSPPWVSVATDRMAPRRSLRRRRPNRSDPGGPPHRRPSELRRRVLAIESRPRARHWDVGHQPKVSGCRPGSSMPCTHRSRFERSSRPNPVNRPLTADARNYHVPQFKRAPGPGPGPRPGRHNERAHRCGPKPRPRSRLRRPVGTIEPYSIEHIPSRNGTADRAPVPAVVRGEPDHRRLRPRVPANRTRVPLGTTLLMLAIGTSWERRWWALCAPWHPGRLSAMTWAAGASSDRDICPPR